MSVQGPYREAAERDEKVPTREEELQAERRIIENKMMANEHAVIIRHAVVLFELNAVRLQCIEDKLDWLIDRVSGRDSDGV